MGQYGNGASVEDIAWITGCSEGAVELYTKQRFTAIESLHDDYVHPTTVSMQRKKLKSVGWINTLDLKEHDERTGSCMMELLWFCMQNLVLMGMHIIPGRQIMGLIYRYVFL